MRPVILVLISALVGAGCRSRGAAERFRTPPGFSVESAAAGARVGPLAAFTFDSLGRPVLAKERGFPTLLLDQNHDGIITSGRELLAGLTGPPNAFSFLAALDGFATRADLDGARNRTPDGKIDVNDAIFKQLILWTDRNHNGFSEEDELESFEHAGFETLYLGYEAASIYDSMGNVVRYRGKAARRIAGGVSVLREASTVRFGR